jgi:hypothetical protein
MSPRFNTNYPVTTSQTEQPNSQVQVYGEFFQEELHFDSAPFVTEMLEFYAVQGDIGVQTAVIMAMVLGDKVSLEETQLRQWTLSYIGKLFKYQHCINTKELLHRQQLWSCANELIKKSSDKTVSVVNQVRILEIIPSLLEVFNNSTH